MDMQKIASLYSWHEDLQACSPRSMQLSQTLKFGKEVPKENFVPKEYPSEIFVTLGRALLLMYYYHI